LVDDANRDGYFSRRCMQKGSWPLDVTLRVRPAFIGTPVLPPVLPLSVTRMLLPWMLVVILVIA
jgi:hypothetical protein